MKKFFVLMIVVFLFVCTGCNFSKDDVNDITDNLFNNYNELSKGEVVEGSYKQFKNINIEASYLGYGYDIINDEYIKKDYINFSAPILDMEKIQDAKLKLIKENNAETIEIEGETMESFSEKYSVAMKVYGKAGKVFSGGLALDYVGSSHSNTYTHFYKNILDVKTFNLYLTNSTDELKELLSDEFKNDLLNLHPEALFDKYGTHMLKEVSMGGRIEVSSQYKSTTAGASAEVKLAVNSHMKLLKGSSLNTELLTECETELSKQNIEYYYNVKQVGGALTNINSVASLNEKYDQWLESFDEKLDYSALSGIVGENSLIALWDLLPEGQNDRRELLYQTFKKLSGDSFASLCENFKINTKRTLNVFTEGTGKVNDYGYEYEDGDEVTLVATPDSDSRFVGWYDGEKLISNNPIYTFNIHVNTKLVAKFRKLNDNSCLLVVHINGYGDVVGAEQQIFSHGDNIILTAQPAYNNEFLGWYVNNILVSDNHFYTFSITDDTTIVAKFTSNEIEKCLLVVNKLGDGNGEVLYEKEYYMRSVATITAIPDEYSVFVGWYKDNELISTNKEYTFIINSDSIYFAKFEPKLIEEYTISTSILPENCGSINGIKDTYSKNELVVLTAKPIDGYVFKEWLIMNESISSNPYSFYIEENIHVVAVFEEDILNNYTLTYNLNNENYGLKADISQSHLDIKENELPIFTVPTSDYLVFKGWYLEGGIQISDEKGNVIHNVPNYTDQYGKWIAESCELIAKWEYNNDYVYVKSVDDLAKMVSSPDKKYVLTKSLDLNGAEWTPITNFTGFLDGNDYSIYNFKITKEGKGSDLLGFVKMNSGTIQNLKLGNASCKKFDSKYSKKYDIYYKESSEQSTLVIGGLAARNNGIVKNCEIDNIYIKGTLADNNNNESLGLTIGGLVGTNNSLISSCKVSNSKFEGYCPCLKEDNGDNNHGTLGGLCGLNTSNIKDVMVTNCQLNLDVRGDGFDTLFDSPNKSYPVGSLGEIIGVQEKGSLQGYAILNNSRTIYVSEGKYTDPEINNNEIIGLKSGGTCTN